MNGLERRYRVRLRKKYVEDLNLSKGDIGVSGKLLALTVGLTAIGLVLGANPLGLLAGISAPTAWNIHNLIEAVKRKTTLQTDIAEIDEQLGMQNNNTNEGSVGRRR